jgi:hypothetical protein
MKLEKGVKVEKNEVEFRIAPVHLRYTQLPQNGYTYNIG